MHLRWPRWGRLCLLLLLHACSTTPPPQGLTVVEPTLPPPTEEEVVEAQRALAARELYWGPIDGALTAETQVAIARFQREAGLGVSGTLDPATQEALAAPPGLELPPGLEPPPRVDRELELPDAATLLAEPPVLPQPPPGVLEPVLREIEAAWEEASAELVELLEAEDEGPGLGDVAQRLAEVERRLSEVRSEAFERILAVRREGGWALLPDPLATELREALAERSLLLRPAEAGWGQDEEAALRWLQRSLLLPQTGEPSLAILEALDIDPSPMFQE